MKQPPNYAEIESAHERIRPYIHRTPVFTSRFFDEMTGAKIFFKCENLQRIGAFKIRGATNALLKMSKAELENGVVTHSSGNHAQAVALAAATQKVKAFIIMPQDATSVKVNAVKGYKGEVIFCEPTLAARAEKTNEVIERTGAFFIPPYDHPDIIAGQGTCFKEFFEEIGKVDQFFTPIGGGGLISGTAICAKHFLPEIKIIGAEPEGADDAFRSILSGKLETTTNPRSIADGLLATLSELTFSIIQKKVDEIITVSEQEIIQAMRWVWERMKLIIEPSSAVAVAALIKKSNSLKNKKIGVLLSGGNVDLKKAVGLF